MALPKQIICMKWGTLYGADYVNRLYAMARRQTKGDLRFVCLTDNREGVRAEVECLPCPTINVPPPLCNTGWRKVALWANSEQLFGLQGSWLFLDLDVVITGSLDDFFEFEPDAPFVVMQNWTQRGQGIGNTSVYRFKVGAAPHLLENLSPRFDEIVRVHVNEQVYVTREIDAYKFWPDAWCLLFKVQCVPAWPLRFWVEPQLPEGARVVAFPGDPNPHDAVEGRWPVKSAWKKMYKTIKPAAWIKENWADAEKHI